MVKVSYGWLAVFVALLVCHAAHAQRTLILEPNDTGVMPIADTLVRIDFGTLVPSGAVSLSQLDPDGHTLLRQTWEFQEEGNREVLEMLDGNNQLLNLNDLIGVPMIPPAVDVNGFTSVASVDHAHFVQPDGGMGWVWASGEMQVVLDLELPRLEITIPPDSYFIDDIAFPETPHNPVTYALANQSLHPIIVRQISAAGLTDINGDTSVDSLDAASLFASWASDDPILDFNSDGVVDAADAGIMFAAWTGDATVVPEPTASMAYACVAMMCLCYRRRWLQR